PGHCTSSSNSCCTSNNVHPGLTVSRLISLPPQQSEKSKSASSSFCCTHPFVCFLLLNLLKRYTNKPDISGSEFLRICSFKSLCTRLAYDTDASPTIGRKW